MTCSERLLLSRARYGVLHVLYIVLFPLFSCRTDSMCRPHTSAHSEGRSKDGFDLYAEARPPRASTPTIP